MSVEVQNAPSLPMRLHDYKAPEPLVREIKPSADTLQVAQHWSAIPSAWQPLCHPRAEEVSREVNTYFISHWKFPNAKAERTFINAGFSKVTCLYFPMAKDDRIHFACRLLTVLFLIDGNNNPILSTLKETMLQYNER
jgi:hypothetical protein